MKLQQSLIMFCRKGVENVERVVLWEFPFNGLYGYT